MAAWMIAVAGIARGLALWLAVAGVAAVPILTDAPATAQAGVAAVTLLPVRDAADALGGRCRGAFEDIGMAAGVIAVALISRGLALWLAVAGIAAVAVVTHAPAATEIGMIGVPSTFVRDTTDAVLQDKALGAVALATSGRGRRKDAAIPGPDAGRGADVIGPAAVASRFVRVAVDADRRSAALSVVAARLDASAGTVGVGGAGAEVALRQRWATHHPSGSDGRGTADQSLQDPAPVNPLRKLPG
jgi:hypothetical protein